MAVHGTPRTCVGVQDRPLRMSYELVRGHPRRMSYLRCRTIRSRRMSYQHWCTGHPRRMSYLRRRTWVYGLQVCRRRCRTCAYVAVHGVYRPRRRTWPSMARSAADDARRTCAYAAIYDKTTFEEAERWFYEANYRFMLYVRAERVPAWRCWFIRKRCMDKFCAKITKIRHTSTGNKKTTNNDMNI